MQPCSKPSFPLDLGRVPTSSNVADGPSRLDCRFVDCPSFQAGRGGLQVE